MRETGSLTNLKGTVRILGIETSCDETAVALVEAPDRILANLVDSQIAHHAPFGGVVPEVAARLHVERVPDLLATALRTAGVDWADLDTIAVTAGPGLATSLLVGASAAKALAIRLNRPLWAVHHLEGHVRSVFFGTGRHWLESGSAGLVLVVSGGHTILVQVGPEGRRLVGMTLDDAAGEALDKGARLLGLEYPGGPALEREAEQGDPWAVKFPSGQVSDRFNHWPETVRPELCFSFSGLKTALLYYLRDHPDANRADVAASYLHAVVEAIAARIERGIELLRPAYIGCGGGVARNRRLRERLGRVASSYGLPLLLAAPELCTDNAAMIVAAAADGWAEQFRLPERMPIRPSWAFGTPLDGG